MVLASLKTDADIKAIPPTLLPDPVTGDNYQRVVDAFPFRRFAANSLGVAVASTLLQLVTASTAAYAFARIEFRCRNLLFGLYLATMMIPLQVLIVPLFIEMRNLGLVDTYAGLLLPTIVSSFGVFLLRQAFLAVPQGTRRGGVHRRRRALLGVLPHPVAAHRPGAGHGRRVRLHGDLELLPVAARHHSGLRPPRHPARRAVPAQGRFTTDWNVVMAGSVMTIVPIVVFYLIAQRWVIRSVAFSGLKG